MLVLICRHCPCTPVLTPSRSPSSILDSPDPSPRHLYRHASPKPRCAILVHDAGRFPSRTLLGQIDHARPSGAAPPVAASSRAFTCALTRISRTVASACAAMILAFASLVACSHRDPLRPLDGARARQSVLPPPRSWLLLLLAAGLGASLLSACFGVSLQRSVWSNYERMQGVVDQAHWFEFALVLTLILRTGRDRRALPAITRAWNA